MQYTFLFIASFFWMPVAICHATAKANAIEDAEFVIEKQKKNRVNQEERLFFKAPTRTTKRLNKPLPTIQALTVEDISFDPTPETYLPFVLEKPRNPPSFDHYCRLGIGSLLLPYLEILLHNYPIGKGVWSTNLAFVPEVWNKKAREAAWSIEGRYGVASWLLQPNLHYQYDWYKYNDATADVCRLKQGKIGLSAQQATASSTQDGQINLNIIDYKDKKINEKLLKVKYKWVKQLDKWSFKVVSYNDIAKYTNDTNQQTRFIISVAPSCYLPLLPSIQLKIGLRMAYHNDPVPGKIPNFDLYPMAKIDWGMATWLTPYIGIKGMGVGGSVMPLHLHDVVAKNPFIASNWPLSHHHQYFKLYGGSKGMVAPHLSYDLHIAYRQIKNQSKIVTVGRMDQIKLAYHPQGYNALKVTGIVNYSLPNTTCHTTIQGSYCKYFDHTNIPNPIWWYHKPPYKLKPTLTYKPHSKVLLRSKLHLHGPAVIKDIDGTATDLGWVINPSLGIDYFVFKRCTVFLMVSNLFNRKDIAYTGYPSRKINVTGGLQYKW